MTCHNKKNEVLFSHKRLVPSMLLVFCVFNTIPQPGFGFAETNSSAETQAKKLISSVHLGNRESLIQQFQELDSSLQASQGSLAECRKFLESFIHEMNTRYGMSLTLAEACRLIRNNFHTLSIPPDMQGPFRIALELFDPDTNLTSQVDSYLERSEGHLDVFCAHFYWPWRL
jgi:hypothetical protein